MYKSKQFLILIVWACFFKSKSQEMIFHEGNVGFNIGGVFSIGSHVQRLGLTFNFFYISDFIQANSELRFYQNIKNLGPNLRYGELAIAQGIVFGYGQKNRTTNPFITTVSNQTGYQYSIGYSYNAWFTPRKVIRTTQQTGIISLQFEDISFITENDLLARPLLDRFRTGAFLIQYQKDSIVQAGINCTLWTGKMGRSIREDSNYPAPGYMDTTNGVYTNYSHGLLSAQVKYHFVMAQVIQANIGADAEQIRNVVQNRIIHDVCWLPKSWFKRHNCHVPMIDREGNQYLYKPEQKIKKAKAYWGIGTNSNLFY